MLTDEKEIHPKEYFDMTEREQKIIVFLLADEFHEAWRKDKEISNNIYRHVWRGRNREINLRDIPPEDAVEMGYDKKSVIDIANTSFVNLSSPWQKELIEAGKVLAAFYPDLKKRILNMDFFSFDEFDYYADIVHSEWSKRNPDDPKAKVDFKSLSYSEKKKDYDQVISFVKVGKQLANKEIDIETQEKTFAKLIDLKNPPL